MPLSQHSGHSIKPRNSCSWKSFSEANQPSNECCCEHWRFSTFMRPLSLDHYGATVCHFKAHVCDNTFCSHNRPVSVFASVTRPLPHQAKSSAGVAVDTSRESTASSSPPPSDSPRANQTSINSVE